MTSIWNRLDPEQEHLPTYVKFDGAQPLEELGNILKEAVQHFGRQHSSASSAEDWTTSVQTSDKPDEMELTINFHMTRSEDDKHLEEIINEIRQRIHNDE